VECIANGVNGIKRAFLQNSPMKGVNEHFSAKAVITPLTPLMGVKHIEHFPFTKEI
jgi:hypothetical protein